MNKKFLSAILFGALVATTGSFVSCNDYDSEIESLKEQIKSSASLNDLNQQVALLQAALDSKISANEAEEAVKAAKLATLAEVREMLGNLDAENLGAQLAEIAGKINAVSSDLTAEIEALKAELDVYVSAQDQQIADLRAALELQKAVLEQVKESDDALKQQIDQIAYYLQNITSLSELNAAREQVAASVMALNADLNVLVTDLRSLVFMPELYVDGIEAIKYPYISDSTLLETSAYTLTRTRDGVTQKIVGITDWNETVPGANKLVVYGPAWPVQYHMNPSASTTVYGDIKGYNNREVEVITRATGLKISSPEKYANGDQLFKNAAGVLTAGIQIENPELLWANGPEAVALGETGYKSYGKENIVALQVNTQSAGKDTIITSDYAMLYPEKVWVEGLVWTKDLKNKVAGVNDEATCNVAGGVHVWDTPEEALLDDQDNLVELYYNDPVGIKLEDFLGVHFYHETEINHASTYATCKTWGLTNTELAHFGLTYEFSLVDYNIDSNVTHDSRYAKIDPATGLIVAGNVNAAGQHVDEQSASSIDREPLVRVLVKQSGKVILDGYILVHITAQPSVYQHQDKEIDFKSGSINFNLCNEMTAVETNWSEFSAIVLTKELEDMEKWYFDANYENVSEYNGETLTVGSDVWNGVHHYTATSPENALVEGLGKVYYRPNDLGTTNHDFMWILSAEELEKLTHHQSGDVTYSTWVRYNRVANSTAKYDCVWLKLTVTIHRNDAPTVTFAEKNVNYWFDRETGADAGLSGIVFDVKEPMDGGDIVAYNNWIMVTLKGNNFSNTAAGEKFYFTPKTTELTALNGKKYTITPQSSATDVKYNNMYCLYLNDKHAYVVGDEAANNATINSCAIDYNEGVFTNDALYAVNGNVYTKIATLNQLTGEIALINNAPARDVLNAIGYEENHANINTELRAEIGVIGKNGCGVATQMNDGLFQASWERPINILDIENKVMVDAHTNGNYIYVADLLHLFDWRGDVHGCMETPATKWFYAYYGVNKISVDLRPSVMTTDMHNGTLGVTKLADITTLARFSTYNGLQQYDFTFDLSAYDYAAKSQDLWDLFQDEVAKKAFGWIYYENNGDNVEKFHVTVPVTVGYTWGEFQKTLVIEIDRTLGN